MSRFWREVSIVPSAARAVAAVLYVVMGLAVVGAIMVTPPKGMGGPLGLGVLMVLTLLACLLLPVFVLLCGYVYADARRRGMNYGLWTLLAVFIPNAVGIILYFILRKPLPATCPSCRAALAPELAFCPACGAANQTVCAQCRRAIQAGWTHCGHCGAAIAR
jgi:predicted RNA-binding Zn-ribbon protein involved in translation (DUF1610 family)